MEARGAKHLMSGRWVLDTTISKCCLVENRRQQLAKEGISSLRRHPEVATQVGFIIADYALLEFLMFHLYAALSDQDPGVSFERFYSMRSINKRSELVVGELTEILDDAHTRALKKLWKRFRAAATRRTEIAHCTFLSKDGGVSRLRLHGTKPAFEDLDTSVFDRTREQYRVLAKDISVLLSLLFPHPDILTERLHEIAAAIGINLTVAPQIQLDGPTPDAIEEIRASRMRIGLSYAPPNADR